MSWHYRILRHPDGILALHEVYCDGAGRPNRYTEQPISFAVDADEGAESTVSCDEGINDRTPGGMLVRSGVGESVITRPNMRVENPCKEEMYE